MALPIWPRQVSPKMGGVRLVSMMPPGMFRSGLQILMMPSITRRRPFEILLDLRTRNLKSSEAVRGGTPN